MPKITLETISNSITELKVSVDNLKDYIEAEIHGLAFLFAKTEERLIERLDKIDSRVERFEIKTE